MFNFSKFDRKKLSFTGSIALHTVVFLLIAFTGVLHSEKLRDNLTEIAFIGGGGGGGGTGDIEGEVAEAAEPEEEAAEAVEPEANEDDFIAQSSPEAPKQAVQPKKAAPKHVKAKGTGGSGGGQGTGRGTGTGSGVGPGSGSGTGGGHGSGHGTGTGAGVGEGITYTPAVRPRVVRSVAPVYPESQRRANVTGVAYLRLLIGYDGRVEDVTLLQSSGSSALDSSAMRACRQWSFTSAKNTAGQNVRCYLDMPIRFDLQR